MERTGREESGVFNMLLTGIVIYQHPAEIEFFSASARPSASPTLLASEPRPAYQKHAHPTSDSRVSWLQDGPNNNDTEPMSLNISRLAALHAAQIS